MQKKLLFKCCFCENIIENDVATIIISTNYEQAEENQHAQQLFCHLTCFEKKLKDPSRLYLTLLLD